MESESLKRQLERNIKKRYILPEYVYMAEDLESAKMTGIFSANFSEIPSTFLDLTKISYKLHGKMPEIRFTKVKEKQIVKLFKEEKLVLKIGYEMANEKTKIVQKIIEAFELTENIFRAVRGFSILENISYIISDALVSEDYDKMLFLLMTALTAGYGFGFNRALFFERRGKFLVGKKAIGPFDEKEAHYTWEELEYNDFSLEEFAKHLKGDIPSSKLQSYISSLRFALFREEGKFLNVKALKIVPFEEIPFSLRDKLLIESDVVIFPLSSAKDGLFILDNKFTKERISNITLRLLIQFYKEIGLLVENFKLKEKLKKMAYNDELTGVKNRRTMRELNVSQGVLVMIDLDNFKYVNDTFGHKAGDELLKRFAYLAKKMLRAEDTILRYGGDEFLLILKDISVDQAEKVVRRFRKHALDSSISFSAGIASFTSFTNEVVKRADKAMYEAKKSGKGICISKEEEA